MNNAIREDRQGSLLCIVLTANTLSLRLFGCIPLCWVRIKNIRSMRAASYHELFQRQPRRLFRTVYWPTFTTGYSRRMHGFYVIRTHKNRRIYCRLKPGLHFRLRSMIGGNRD